MSHYKAELENKLQVSDASDNFTLAWILNKLWLTSVRAYHKNRTYKTGKSTVRMKSWCPLPLEISEVFGTRDVFPLHLQKPLKYSITTVQKINTVLWLYIMIL